MKNVPASIFNSQLAAIDAVITIFSDGTIKSSQNKISQAPLMKNQANQENNRLPTSKGDQVEKPATISKGVLEEIVHTRPNIKNVTIKKVDDQEPIFRRTKSRKINKTGNIIKTTSEPISQRTSAKIYKNLPFKGTCHAFAYSYGKLDIGT